MAKPWAEGNLIWTLSDNSLDFRLVGGLYRVELGGYIGREYVFNGKKDVYVGQGWMRLNLLSTGDNQIQ